MSEPELLNDTIWFPSRCYALKTKKVGCQDVIQHCRLIVPKSYQHEGQPRITENEFSHDRLTMIYRESDNLGKSKMAVFYA